MEKFSIQKIHDSFDKKGFTLVEVIVVLVILAILAAMLVPKLTGWIDEAKNKTVSGEAHLVLSAAQAYASEQYAKNGKGTGDVGIDPDNLSGYLSGDANTDEITNLNYDSATGRVTQFNYVGKNGKEIQYGLKTDSTTEYVFTYPNS